MKKATMYSTILVAALAMGTAGPASAGQAGSGSGGSGGQSGSSSGASGGAGQSGSTTGSGSGQSGAMGGQAGTSGAGDNTSVGSGGQAGATSPRKDDRQDFIEKAAVANMAEIQLGQLAETNAQDPQVKQFAQMMVTDHTAALDQLRSAAGSATLPTALDKKHQKVHDKLSKLQGAEFDRAYMSAMVDAHKDAEKLLSKRAGKKNEARGESATHGQTAMAGSAGTHGSASGTAGTSGSGDTSGATGTSGTGTPSQSGDASGTMSGSTSGASSSGAVGTSGSNSSYAAGGSSTPGSVDEWAAMTLPKVQSHLQQARTIESQVKAQSKGAAGNGAATTPGAQARPPQQP